MNLSDCQFSETKAELAIAVNKIIIDYGHILGHGWKCLLEIIAKIKDLRSLQAIVETFLDKIDVYIMDVIDIINSIERSIVDNNQKYQCLTLIWAIGDHGHKYQQEKVMHRIYELLLIPDEMFVLGT